MPAMSMSSLDSDHSFSTIGDPSKRRSKPFKVSMTHIKWAILFVIVTLVLLCQDVFLVTIQRTSHDLIGAMSLGALIVGIYLMVHSIE